MHNAQIKTESAEFDHVGERLERAVRTARAGLPADDGVTDGHCSLLAKLVLDALRDDDRLEALNDYDVVRLARDYLGTTLHLKSRVELDAATDAKGGRTSSMRGCLVLRRAMHCTCIRRRSPLILI